MSLKNMAVAASIFVHFEHPDTKEPLYVQIEQPNAETGQSELVNDLSRPIGVMACTPGSKTYRKAEADMMTAMIANKGRPLTGEQVFDRDTARLAATVFEYVNFDYNGKPCSMETNKELFEDVEYVAVREQILAKQADLGNASKARSKN